MHALTNKPEIGARFYSGLVQMATTSDNVTDLMKIIQYMAGVMVETYFLFDEPDCAMEGSLDNLARMLEAEPYNGKLGREALPPAHIIDFETERGRHAARLFFEEWMECLHEFHALLLTILQNVLISWENDGLNRGESFRLLTECVRRAMAFEIAAQELCDIVIEHKVAKEGWCLGDCIASLSALAGRRLAQSLNSETCYIFKGSDLPDNLDHTVHVMTQEAVRLGVPAGTDWRFGLAANDMPVNAPVELIQGVEPFCESFFKVIGTHDLFDQSVSCAKAAGRMIAVAAGGELPEIEPAIAKPLAMAAMTESYKFVCIDHAIKAR